ncbi:hypothetical protein BIY26_08865 [Brenneria goodwinii]|uniref:Tail fiber protein n=1 Tax=Brenneria goodwinii TaxID=1109412 RepID=A0AAE8ESL0_9GAMM|nr:hypothetical protein [Brenneria goodwinii]ATA26572.1 hypothetical protein AWC36_22080 [Brenneria goodwinii]RLM25370.1 hypothetical protein BIY26_08865 [Brenneria goodwinii]
MWHLDNQSAVPEMPEPKPRQSNSPRWFGESEMEGGISWPGADWFNIIQAELLNVLRKANIDPDKTTLSQLSDAIHKLGDAALRGDLADGSGTELAGFEKTNAYNVLKYIATRKDLGLPFPVAAGYENDGEQIMFALKKDDEEILLRGGLYAGKKLFGIRRNACVTSFRGGPEEQGRWNSQVTGVANNLQLASYGSPDKVGAYGDIAGSIEETYQALSNVVSFTNDGFITDNPDVLEKAKVGMIVVTDSTPKKWNIIKDINKETGLITGWDNWATATAYVMPSSGEKVQVDPEGKLWTLNYNLILRNGGRAKTGVVAELGIINQNGQQQGVVGIDIVILPGSTSGGDTALVLRGANKTGERWLQSISCRHYTNYGIAFYNSGIGLALADIMCNGDAVSGIEFQAKNTVFSMRWRLGGDGIYAENTVTAFNPQGTVMRQGVLNSVITTDASMSPSIKSYRLNTGSETSSTPKIITLPDTAGIIAGHEQYLKCYGNAPITFKTYGSATVLNVPDGNVANPPVGNGTATVTFYPVAGAEYKLDWDGNSWRIWG